MKEVLKNVSDIVTDQPIEIKVDLKEPTWWERIWKIKVRKYSLNQITYGNLIRISKLLVDIELSALDKLTTDNIIDQSTQLIGKHGDSLAKVIAIAMHNKRTEPPPKLIDFVKDNFTAQELFGVLVVVIRQMDVKSFMHTIISIKGASILEKTVVSATGASKNGVSL